MAESCGRCSSGLMDQTEEFDTCMSCGHEDYSKAPRQRLPRRNRPLFSAAGVLELSYTGGEQRFRHRTVDILLPDPRYRRPVRVRTCPFDACQSSMYSKDTAKELRKKEQLFNCSKDHWIRVRFSETAEGGWR